MDRSQEIPFIQSFIQRERRERAQFELGSPKKRGTFLGRLCHTYERVLDMRYVHRIPNDKEDPHMVKKILIQRRSPEQVYVISMLEAIDGTYMDLENALRQVFFYGFPSILLCIPGKLGYFQAEQVVGSPPRYIMEKQ